MKTNLLVDSENFTKHLYQDILNAKSTVMVQTMTFEGDEAGISLINALLKSKAKERLLLIDSYTKAVINDHFIFSPHYLRSSSFRKELRETKRLLKEAKNDGIVIQFTNPLGFMMVKYPLRNHKKMIIIDGEISYIGGINFSDHNFSWHDAMVRIEDTETGKHLSEDFMLTWSGVNQSKKIVLNDSTIFLMNGSKSRKEYDELFSIIGLAKESIDIFSPYVSDPLLRILKRKELKAKIRIISPRENNKSIFKKHLNNELTKGYFELLHYQKGMSHLKAILIDEETLIMGSSNFDFVSYHFEQEVILVSKDPILITEFMSKIHQVDLSFCERVDQNGIIKPNGISYLMHLLNWVTDKASRSLLKTK